MLQQYKVEKIDLDLAQKVFFNKQLARQSKEDPASVAGLLPKNATQKYRITVSDAERVMSARKVAEIKGVLSNYVTGFNKLNACIDSQKMRVRREDAAAKQLLYDGVRAAMRPFGQGAVGFHMLGKDSGKAVGLVGLEKVTVEKKHGMDVSVLEQTDGMSKMFVNMVESMAKEGWAKSKLRLTDAFRCEIPGVFLVSGRLQRFNMKGECYLDQGVIHVVMPSAVTDASADGGSAYKIQDMFFYDYNVREAQMGHFPPEVIMALAASPYYQKRAKL